MTDSVVGRRNAIPGDLASAAQMDFVGLAEVARQNARRCRARAFRISCSRGRDEQAEVGLGSDVAEAQVVIVVIAQSTAIGMLVKPFPGPSTTYITVPSVTTIISTADPSK